MPCNKYCQTLFISFCLLITVTNAQTLPLFIGTYTSGKSEGIYMYQFNPDSTTLHFSSVAKSSNPSFLAIAPNKKFVYAVYENADSTQHLVTGKVAAFSIDGNSLKPINQQLSMGKHPCHVAIDKTGKWLVVCNYTSGNFAVLPILNDGSIGEAVKTIQFEGKSIEPNRQKSPHTHSAQFTPNNKGLLVQDLGIDKIFYYNFNQTTGEITPSNPPFVATIAGSGPRHISFHPTKPIVYVIEELSNTITVIQKEKIVQRISSVPTNYNGSAGAADIHVSKDGKFVYASNRSTSNTIGVFAINKKTGWLSLVQHISTNGNTPRNFTLDPTENYLLVANQKSDNIVIYKRDKKTGKLSFTGKEINVPNPVCLKFLNNE